MNTQKCSNDFEMNKCPRLSILYAKNCAEIRNCSFHYSANKSEVFFRQEGMKAIAERCMLIRERLRERLRILGGPGRWDHIIKPGGLYCCFGLNGESYIIRARGYYSSTLFIFLSYSCSA